MTGNEIRRQFLEFFQKHAHKIVRSSSLVPSDDPTLLFTNAGMVQFKRTFLGEEYRDYVRATTSQKCVRAGGKHNDLENVGYTARHHTFFEMLGNFSFGDYFKEDAIEFAWDLMVNEYKLPVDKLWVSIYLDDDEAHDIWHNNIGVPQERIVRFGEKDNFWAMGDTGPCGPCSEIHLDRGKEFGCKKTECKIGCDCDRFLEIWNLVFMQFNRDAEGNMKPLPKPSIDTGMGLERITSIIQNVNTNYDTDLIMPIMNRIEELAQINFGDSFESDVAMKVIADHSRAAAFLIGDGVLPSNEGRGYVLRRIIRRAIRYGRNIGLIKPFLHKSVETVFEIAKPAYPELFQASAFITNVVNNEEIRFSETLDKGLKVLTDSLSEMKAKGEKVFSGKVIFKLYDTYGFPVDIVKDVLRDMDISLDIDQFEHEMNIQREKSKRVVLFASSKKAYKEFAASGIKSEFVGYDKLTCNSEIIALVKDGEEVENISEKDRVEIVTKTTPFYGESGGQVGDKGKMTASNGLEIEVHDTIKDPAGLIIHKGETITGSVEKAQTLTLSVNEIQRKKIAASHSATHILHYSLRKVLGSHVKQAGSMVSYDKLRFDFTHFSQVKKEDLDKIEKIVNKKIRENLPVKTEEMAVQKALDTGATAIFEEKYGDFVRVVSIDTFSKELCSGTHVDKTGDIGLFKIVGESSIASGIRRIEALTGDEAVSYVQKIEKILLDTANLIKEKPEGSPRKIERILAVQKSYEKEIEKLKGIIASKSTEHFEKDLKTVNGVKVFAKKVEADSPAALRDLADKFKDRIKSGVIVLASISDERVFLIAVVTKDLVGPFHAGKIVEELAVIVGGGGGGRPDMAQAGGTKPEKVDLALKAVARGQLSVFKN